MKRSELITIIGIVLDDIMLDNEYDINGADWCAEKIFTHLEAKGIGLVEKAPSGLLHAFHYEREDI